jgi:hypothetical protein
VSFWPKGIAVTELVSVMFMLQRPRFGHAANRS